MRARYVVLAGAVFAGGMLAAASAQEGRPFDTLRNALISLTTRVASLEQTTPQLTTDVTSLSHRVANLEQQPAVLPALKVLDANGQLVGRADFSSTSFAVTVVDGIAVALPVNDGGFRPAAIATTWFQSTDCSGDAFLTTDTGVIRQALVFGTTAIYGKGQFRQLQFKSRRGYPTGACLSLTFSTMGSEMGTIDLSGYRGPFSVAE